MKMYKHRLLTIVSLLAVLTSINSCDDFIEIGPPKTEIVFETVFASDASATSALRGIYSMMMNNSSFARAGIEELTGIYTDELTNFATRSDQLQFSQNSLTAKNGDVLTIFWREAYKYINNANLILEGVENPNGLSSAGKKQLEGEARFIRSFCYFYLVNLFGDVPYLTSTDYKITSKASRTSVEEVYNNIEADLLRSIDLLSTDFSYSNNERIQPNQGAAIALLARVYLYRSNWGNAELMATRLIDRISTYSLVSDLNQVFLPNSRETIWQLKPVMPGVNTPQAQLFILTTPPNSTSRRVTLTASLTDSFEATDKRKLSWIKTFSNATGSWNYSFKYKAAATATVTEYSMVLRLAEQYLIRSEARAQLNNLSGALTDLNTIRNRAGLAVLMSGDVSAVLIAIEAERKKELFTEWGHRLLDLKRTGRAGSVLSPLKPGWQATDLLFPIPDSERILNPNLSQNPGY